jgi:hypothetical protein
MSLARNDSPDIDIRIIDQPMEIWGSAYRWVERGLEHEFALISAADVFDRIVQRRMTLWGIYDRGRLSGAMVTQIETGSRGKALNVIALGGSDMDQWLEPLIEALTAYGKNNRCRYIFEMGRRGWLRVLDKHGWVDGPATMIKVI